MYRTQNDWDSSIFTHQTDLSLCTKTHRYIASGTAHSLAHTHMQQQQQLFIEDECRLHIWFTTPAPMDDDDIQWRSFIIITFKNTWPIFDLMVRQQLHIYCLVQTMQWMHPQISACHMSPIHRPTNRPTEPNWTKPSAIRFHNEIRWGRLSFNSFTNSLSRLTLLSHGQPQPGAQALNDNNT